MVVLSELFYSGMPAVLKLSLFSLLLILYPAGMLGSEKDSCIIILGFVYG